MARESFEDQLSRVEQMAGGDPTWDLSNNDIAALKAVLADRVQLKSLLDVPAPTYKCPICGGVNCEHKD